MSAIIALLAGLMIGRNSCCAWSVQEGSVRLLMTSAYINRIATAVPPNNVHAGFVRLAETLLPEDRRQRTVFRRMAEKSGIERRYSFLTPAPENDTPELDSTAFYVRGQFPSTAVRMRLFAAKAPELAATAVDRLGLGSERDGLTHLLITCCTGFTAPGLDLELVERCRLPPSIERTIIGFMGCYAAINALKLARHIVRSNPKARILIVNFELCTLHLQDTSDLAKLLTFLLWGDGCAATLVSSEPHGLSLDSFRAVHFPDTTELMRWNIGDSGFDMVLSGKVPVAIEQGIRIHGNEILEGADPNAISLWAVHPGGRTVVDAVERAFAIAPTALSASRGVLRDFGNMSSASIMFVLRRLLGAGRRNAAGCCMAFGPGLIAETMLFRTGRAA
jgi:predicted naringenin-chalcone synthase